jgi:[ribosomal protein S5]-alanine N-acetyltransferase
MRWPFQSKQVEDRIPAEPNCYLREMRPSDKTALKRMMGEPKYLQYMEVGALSDDGVLGLIEWARASRREKPRDAHPLTICLSENDAVVGWCDLSIHDRTHSEGTIGYIVDEAYTGHGYATSAAKGLIRFGFHSLKLHRLFAQCDPDNAASARVLEKAGMQLEGRLRGIRFINGSWRDRLQFSITEDEFVP